MQQQTSQMERTLHQRSSGAGRLHVTSLDGVTRIANLYQEGCAKLRIPKDHHAALQAIMINSSGGMTGGDRLHWDFRLGERSQLCLTTQACERVYAASSDRAETRTAINLAQGAELLWLPQETILFNLGRFHRRLDVRMQPNSRLLMVEPIVLGRTEMGEAVTNGLIHDSWRIHLGDELLHAEDFRLDGPIANMIASMASTNSNIAMASLVLIGDDAEHHLDGVRAGFGTFGGASCWNGKLVARCVAPNSYDLRKTLIPVLEQLSKEIPLPKIWTL